LITSSVLFAKNVNRSISGNWGQEFSIKKLFDFKLASVNNCNKSSHKKTSCNYIRTTNEIKSDKKSKSLNLKDDGDDVVSDVSLPRQLLPVVGGVGQKRRDVEHDLVALVLRVHGVQPGGVV
jgi:hypothetical protein